MRHRRAGALIAAVILSVALAGPATAATESVQIDLHIEFPGTETFTATGFCPSGTAESFGFMFAGGGRAGTFHLFKTLTCDDGSGTLTIRVEAGPAFGTPGTVGGWNVVGGTVDYETTRGGGHLVGVGFDGGIDDTYTGRLNS